MTEGEIIRIGLVQMDRVVINPVILVVVITIMALPKMFYRFKVMAAPKNQQRRTASTSRFEMKKKEPFLSINVFYSFNKANLF